MRKQELIDAIEDGAKLSVTHYIRSVSYCLIYNGISTRITERQYNNTKEHLKGRLQHDAVYGGLTTHFYFLKQV